MALTSIFEGDFGAKAGEPTYAAGMTVREAAGFIHNLLKSDPDTEQVAEAFTQADIELALDDRGWLVGGKRMAGELDPLSRQVQVNKSRYYWLRDPLVKQAVRLWTDYALGSTAMTWKAMKEVETGAKGGLQQDDEKQSTLDSFMKSRANRWYTSKMGQRRLSHRLLVDGELFFAFFEPDSTAKAGTVRTFDCLQMSDIITDPDDEGKVVAYKRVCNAGNQTSTGGQSKVTRYYRPWDYDGAEPKWGYGELQPYYGGDPMKIENIKFEDGCRMYHLPFDPMERRGTTLISASSDWSREHRRLMTARVAIVQALSRFAWKGKVKGGQKAINSIVSKMQSTYATTGLSGGTEQNPANAPGGFWAENAGVELDATPRATGAGDAKSDSDQLKLMVCAGTGIMLHYLGDGGNANLATATAMELPMLKMFGAYQELWKDAWRDMFSIVLDEEVDEDPTELQITLPNIIEEDLQKLGSFLTTFTAAFPEAKIPAVMQRCLESMDIQDIDDVMDTIAENKEEQDSITAQNQQQTHQNNLALVVAKGKANQKQNPAGQQDGGAAGVSPDAVEAEREKQLGEVLKLKDRLEALLEAIQ